MQTEMCFKIAGFRLLTKSYCKAIMRKPVVPDLPMFELAAKEHRFMVDSIIEFETVNHTTVVARFEINLIELNKTKATMGSNSSNCKMSNTCC
jgi:hypothetical protein